MPDSSLIPGLGRFSGGGNDNPFPYICLQNSMNRGAWQTPVHGVAKSRKQVNDWAHRSVLYITWYKFFIRCMIYNIFSHSCGSEGKAFALNVGDLGLIPGSRRSPGEGNGNPLQYSYLENPIDWGSWWATVQAVAKSQTWLSDFTFTSHSVGYFSFFLLFCLFTFWMVSYEAQIS